MATVQDYRQARRIGQISLTNLIARNIAEGGGFGSVGKAVSQKFAAKRTRIKEAFDPLNIASMLVGRSKLGTAILGRMMGRGAEDIQYFARKGAGREAAYDPFFARVSPGSLQPVKQDEGVADVFAKIYNLLKKNIDDEAKRKEVEKNFREEQALEDERRFKELLSAIIGSKRPTATPVEKKEGGGLLDFIKGMFANVKEMFTNLMSFLEPFIDLSKTIMTSFGKGFLSLIARLGTFLLSPVGIALLGILTVAALGAYVYDLWLDRDKTGIQQQKALESGQAAGGGYGGEAEYESMKESPEKEAAREKIISKFNKSKKGNIASATLTELNALREDILQYGDPRLQLKSNPSPLIKERSAKLDAIEAEIKNKKAKQPSATPVPAGTTSDGTSKQTASPTSSAGAASTATAGGTSTSVGPTSTTTTGGTSTPATSTSETPTTTPSPTTSPMPSTPSMPPVMTATNQNMELQDEMNVAMSNAPMIFNKSSTNGMNLPGSDMGTVTGAAAVRNDSLDNIMDNLRRRTSVM
jgi:hypothetical protein